MLKVILWLAAGYLLKTWVDAKGGVQAAYESVTGKANTPVASQATPASDTSIASQILSQYLKPTSSPAASGQPTSFQIPGYEGSPIRVVTLTPNTGGQVN